MENRSDTPHQKQTARRTGHISGRGHATRGDSEGWRDRRGSPEKLLLSIGSVHPGSDTTRSGTVMEGDGGHGTKGNVAEVQMLVNQEARASAGSSGPHIKAALLWNRE